MAVFSPIVGYFADRYNRYVLMVICDVARAGLVLLLLATPEGSGAVGVIVGIKVMLSTLSAQFEPCRRAVLPGIVNGDHELVVANTIQTQTWSLCQFGGSALGGAFTAYAGINANFVVDSCSYALSAVFVILAYFLQRAGYAAPSSRSAAKYTKVGAEVDTAATEGSQPSGAAAPVVVVATAGSSEEDERQEADSGQSSNDDDDEGLELTSLGPVTPYSATRELQRAMTDSDDADEQEDCGLHPPTRNHHKYQQHPHKHKHKHDTKEPAEKVSRLRAMAEGWVYLWKHKDLLWITIFKALSNVSLAAAIIAEVNLIETAFSSVTNVSVGLGLVMGAEAMGNLVTPLLLMRYTGADHKRMKQALLLSYILHVFAFALIAWSPSLTVLVFGGFVGGCGWSLQYVYCMSLLQVRLPPSSMLVALHLSHSWPPPCSCAHLVCLLAWQQLGVPDGRLGRVFAFSLAIRVVLASVGSLGAGMLLDLAGFSGHGLGWLVLAFNAVLLLGWGGWYYPRYKDVRLNARAANRSDIDLAKHTPAQQLDDKQGVTAVAQ